MEELRERAALPSDVDLSSEEASADLVTRLASHLAPGLEHSVGSVHWKEGETTRVDWTAEGFEDGALVVVCLRPYSREVTLLVIAGFAPRSEQDSKATTPLLIAILMASVAVGIIRGSVWWAVLVFIGALAAWIGVDIVRQELRERRTRTPLDRAAWSRRFQDAIGSLGQP
jgi:hypothetical protein